MAKKKYKHDGTDIIDAHTLVKYDLYRDYLSDYIRVYFQNSHVQKLRIFIADLFCGGGFAKDEFDNPVFCSPLIAIETCQKLQKEISEKRGRPVEIEPYFFFNDLEPTAIKYLKIFIQDFFPHYFKNCSFYNKAFEDVYLEVLHEMKSLESSSKGNRKFFFIDPYGYLQVPMQAIQMIKKSGKSEILWNFMIDYTAHYWTPENQKKIDFYKIFGTSPAQKEALINRINSLKSTFEWHAIRHVICELIHYNSRFVTMSDFAIQMDTSHKFMTLIHLADSPKARDVMTGSHWANGNVTQTYNYDGLQYQNITRQVGQDPTLFTFSKLERENTIDRSRSLVFDLINRTPGISLPEITRVFAQQYSALQEQDIQKVLTEFEKDIVCYDIDGQETRSKTKRHSFQISPQLSFPLPIIKKKE
ncbi:three-Cys-motif partner protein TcmP [Kiloniella sp. b19]|uniref:three-Cys-motif partner protein TcmP n=1 Tax=Kiloniella sp. GXU_MW_B19 TaxID=3141326 RepID=UPI0031D48E31